MINTLDITLRAIFRHTVETTTTLLKSYGKDAAVWLRGLRLVEDTHHASALESRVRLGSA
jgi:hypothetical protein